MSEYKPRTNQTMRAELLMAMKQVGVEAGPSEILYLGGKGIELLRLILMDLDAAESIVFQKTEPCAHGAVGGCEVTCQDCGHTCHQHHVRGGGYCLARTKGARCHCCGFRGTEG